MGISFGAFWMRTAFRAVPGSLGEAARIDGAGSWSQLWRVYLPVARPAVLTLVLLSFLWTWNDYFLALVLVSDSAHQPVTLGLGAFSGRYLVQINLLSAAAPRLAADQYAADQLSFANGFDTSVEEPFTTTQYDFPPPTASWMLATQCLSNHSRGYVEKSP
jgi:hypothetical protein